jgi:hypothetical protein
MMVAMIFFAGRRRYIREPICRVFSLSGVSHKLRFVDFECTYFLYVHIYVHFTFICMTCVLMKKSNDRSNARAFS